jgi:hypothetical protein
MLRFITEFALSRSALSLQANLLVQPRLDRPRTGGFGTKRNRPALLVCNKSPVCILNKCYHPSERPTRIFARGDST